MNTALVYVLCAVWCCCSGYNIPQCGSDGTLNVTETQTIKLTCTGITDNETYWDVPLSESNPSGHFIARCTWPTSPCPVNNGSSVYEVSRTQYNTSTLTVKHTTRDSIAGTVRCGRNDSSKAASCIVSVVPVTTTTTTTQTSSTTATETPSSTAKPPTSTSTRDTRTTNDDDDDDGGLPIPVIAGGAGGGLLVIIIVVVVVVVRKRRKDRKRFKGSPKAPRNADPLDDDDDFEEHINCLYGSADATHYSAASRRLTYQNADAANTTNEAPGTAFGLAAAPISASPENAGKAVPNDYEEAGLYSTPNNN